VSSTEATTFDDDDAFPKILKDSDGRSPRIEGLLGLPDTPKRHEVRRLAAAVRLVVEHLTSTTASVEHLAEAADQVEALAESLGGLPSGMTYRSMAEAATNGTLAHDPRDPEWFSFVDDSPFIGLANPLSPPVRLTYNADITRVVGEVTFGSAYEGPPGCVHGGYVAAVFDELLGATQSMSGAQGMTAHLGIDYRSPTPLGVPLRMEVWLDRRDGRKIYAKGAMYVGDTLTAEADALFIAFDREKFRALLDDRNEGLDPDA